MVVPTLLSCLLATPSAITNTASVTVSFTVGFSLLCVGASIRALCYRSLGRQFTFELSLKQNHKLYTGGPYAVVRHPSYTGALLGQIGLTLCMFGSGSWWAECHVGGTLLGKVLVVHWGILICLMSGLVFTRVGKEDLVLKEAFQSEWVEWARRTPYAMIPFIY